MYKLQLLVHSEGLNEDVWIDFFIRFEAIDGAFADPDNNETVNLVIGGEPYTVLKDERIFEFINKNLK